QFHPPPRSHGDGQAVDFPGSASQVVHRKEAAPVLSKGAMSLLASGLASAGAVSVSRSSAGCQSERAFSAERTMPPNEAAPRGAPSIILASASPRRRELLAALGLPFAVRPLDVDETPPPGLTAVEAVRAIALVKAVAAAALSTDVLLLVADT